MEPRIQYAQTRDGVSITYYMIGKGTLFVKMPLMPWSPSKCSPNCRSGYGIPTGCQRKG